MSLQLAWEGCANLRDLGGLPAAGGRRTRMGAFVRGAAVERLSAAGWDALRKHGIRTVVDLRNHDELGAVVASRPPGVRTVHVPLDSIEDREFWDVWGTGPQFGTPLYYGPFLERHPERAVEVLAALATAPAGGVLYHCMGGRDRTGLITVLLLASPASSRRPSPPTTRSAPAPTLRGSRPSYASVAPPRPTSWSTCWPRWTSRRTCAPAACATRSSRHCARGW